MALQLSLLQEFVLLVQKIVQDALLMEQENVILENVLMDMSTVQVHKIAHLVLIIVQFVTLMILVSALAVDNVDLKTQRQINA